MNIEQEIEKYLKTIEGCARKYSKSKTDFDDLKSEGILTIIRIIQEGKINQEILDKKKISKDNYINRSIRINIMKYAFEHSFPFKIPSNNINNKKITEGFKRGIFPVSKYFSPEQDTDIVDIIEQFDSSIPYKCFIEKKSYREVSKETGISIATITRIIRKARRQIKRIIKK